MRASTWFMVAIAALCLTVAYCSTAEQAKAIAKTENVHAQLVQMKHALASRKDSNPWLECWDCEQAVGAIINYYLNAVLNGIIVPTCANVCSTIESPLKYDECMIVCDYVGIMILVNGFDALPIDVIYPCQKAQKCMIADCVSKESCATVTSVTATPPHSNGDQIVKIVGSWNMTQLVGAGLLRFVTHATKGTQAQLGPDDYYIDYYDPGPDSTAHHIDTSQIEFGSYTTYFYVCEGNCGQPWPHTRTLAVGSVNWTNYPPPSHVPTAN